jgi:hypothetical protein
MIEPTVTPRVKQRDNLARNRIDTGQVRAFAEVAAMTCKGQIAVVISPAMLAGYDVPDVMRQGTAILRQEAIFAAVPGSGPDQCPRCRLHR